MSKLSLSEKEVLRAIAGIKNLPYIGRTEFKRYKRHEKAITKLKEAGVIVLNKETRILEIVDNLNSKFKD